MKGCIIVLASAALAFSVGCGGSGGPVSSIINPPPVQAQTFTYSNAAMNGTYSLALIRGEVESDYGSFKADGNGNITAGSLTITESGTGVMCTLTFTGTYTIKSDATGTASVTLAPSAGAGCPESSLNNATMSYVILAGQQGSALLLSPAASNGDWLPGTAIKQ